MSDREILRTEKDRKRQDKDLHEANSTEQEKCSNSLDELKEDV